MAHLAKDISDDMFSGPHLSLICFAAVHVDCMVYEECSSVLSVELLFKVSISSTLSASTIAEQPGHIGSRDIISAWTRTGIAHRSIGGEGSLLGITHRPTGTYAARMATVTYL